jgi:hypothetical protein
MLGARFEIQQHANVTTSGAAIRLAEGEGFECETMMRSEQMQIEESAHCTYVSRFGGRAVTRA